MIPIWYRDNKEDFIISKAKTLIAVVAAALTIGSTGICAMAAMDSTYSVNSGERTAFTLNVPDYSGNVETPYIQKTTLTNVDGDVKIFSSLPSTNFVARIKDVTGNLVTPSVSITSSNYRYPLPYYSGQGINAHYFCLVLGSGRYGKVANGEWRP